MFHAARQSPPNETSPKARSAEASSVGAPAAGWKMLCRVLVGKGLEPSAFIGPSSTNPAGEQFGPAAHAEVSENHFRVLVDGVLAQVEPGRDLFVAIAIQQAAERLPHARRQIGRRRFVKPSQRAADQGRYLLMQFLHEGFLPGREIPLVGRANQRKPAHLAVWSRFGNYGSPQALLIFVICTGT